MATSGPLSRLRDRVFAAPSAINGRGCFAKVPFRAGDYIGTYRGAAARRDGAYVLWLYDSEGKVLEGRSGRSLLRWLNHSDRPNARFEAFDLYALEDIAAGDEVTFDYQGGDPQSVG